VENDLLREEELHAAGSKHAQAVAHLKHQFEEQRISMLQQHNADVVRISFVG
jgi:hypothetical protein